KLPRRLTWALGLLDYAVNMFRATAGMPLDESATEEGVRIAKEGGFFDLKLHHLNSRLTRACYCGDGLRFPELFAEAQERVRQQGRPLLLESRISLMTPLYYLERGEGELASAAAERLRGHSERQPMDRWLKLYAQVAAACARVQAEEGAGALDAIVAAVAAA